ncbi:hypothetical protein K438DRAFT_2008279 [Mycena galopus ATCC 62051]|nr:hypothetical protein K438DRAFT_2008279 [Mycena galopus ATCC 62051]
MPSSASLIMPRPSETPVETMAPYLPPGNLLAEVIEARCRVKLNAEPKLVLTQFDKPKGPWPTVDLPPVLPPTYPPPVHFSRDGASYAVAFDTRLNGRLEWLGDALVAFGIVLSLHRSLPDFNAPSHPDLVGDLKSGAQLAHLALLYSLQLHEKDPTPVVRKTVPESLSQITAIADGSPMSRTLCTGFLGGSTAG